MGSGEGVFKQKNGVDFELRSLTATSSKITLTDNTNDIGIDVNQVNITGTGALDSGSITSGFGSIDTGASNITTTGTIKGGIMALDDTATAFYLNMKSTDASMSADRDLVIDVNNVNRTIDLSGDIITGGTITTANSLTTSGAFALTLTQTATTNATLPEGTITLTSLTGTETLTNKTLTTPVITGDISLSGSLTMTSTTDAFTPPTLTTGERDALTPSDGNIVYNSSLNTVDTYHDSQWNSVVDGTLTGTAYSSSVTGAVAILSLRKVTSSYSGFCCKIRETGGDTLLDIGFDNRGLLDKVAFDAHIGVNNGHIHTIYDQSGGGHNFANSTTTRQPQVIYTGSDIPEIHWDGSDFLQGVNAATAMGIDGGTYYMSTMAKTSASADIMFIIGTPSNYYEAHFGGAAGTITSAPSIGDNNAFTVSPNWNNGSYHTISTKSASSSNYIRYDGSDGTPQASVNPSVNSTLYWGGRITTFPYTGIMNELIIWNIVPSEGTISAIETDQNGLWVSSNTLLGGYTLSKAITLSSSLTMSSTTDTFRPPFLTTTQRDAISAPSEGSVIYNDTANELQLYTTSWGSIGGGETNTASNVGSGEGVFKQKNGVDFELRSLTATSSKITLTDNTNDIGIDVNQVNITGTGALDSGSITSGFGSIDNGSSNITTTGTIDGGTVKTTSGLSATTSVLTYTGATGANEIVIPTNLEEGLVVRDSSVDFITLDSTTGVPVVNLQQDTVIEGNMKYNLPYMELYTDTGTTTTSSGTWVKAGLNDVKAGLSYQFETPSIGRLTYVGTKTHTFKVSAVLSVTGTTTDKWEFAFSKNGSATVLDGTTVYCSFANTDESISIKKTLELITDDYIEIFARRTTGSGTSTIEHMNFDIIAIPIREYKLLYSPMTSNTTPSPQVASASTDNGAGREAWRAFNGIPSTSNPTPGEAECWLSVIGSFNDGVPQNTYTVAGVTIDCEWLKIDLGRIVTLNKYKIFERVASPVPPYMPTIWRVRVSTDDSAFTQVDSQTGQSWVNGESKEFTINPTQVRYIYILCEGSNTNGVLVGELELYGIG